MKAKSKLVRVIIVMLALNVLFYSTLGPQTNLAWSLSEQTNRSKCISQEETQSYDYKFIGSNGNLQSARFDTVFSGYGYHPNMLAVEPQAYGSCFYLSNPDSFFISKFSSQGELIDTHFLYVEDHPTCIEFDDYGNLYIGKKNGGVDKFMRYDDSVIVDFITNVVATCIYPSVTYDSVIYVSDTVHTKLGKYSAVTGNPINANFLTNLNAMTIESWGSYLYIATGYVREVQVYNNSSGLLIGLADFSDSGHVGNMTSMFIAADSILYITHLRDSITSQNDTLHLSMAIGLDAARPFQNNSSNLTWWPIAFGILVRVVVYVLTPTRMGDGESQAKLSTPTPPEPTNAGVVIRDYVNRRNILINEVNNSLQQAPAHGQPVKLVTFYSYLNGSSVTLTWLTNFESHNSGFEIERKVTCGDWKLVGYMKGSGTTYEPREYVFRDKNLSSGIYNYRLKQIDFNGNFEYFELPDAVTIGVPDKFFLDQNYPNPFNPRTTVAYGIPSAGNVRLKVFDMTGREMITIVNEFKDAGYYVVKFNASSLASGTYIYRIESGNFVSARKMVLLK